MPYYLYDGKETLGPFEVSQLASRPGFQMDTWVFPVGSTTPEAWKPAASFPDLARALELKSRGISLTAAPSEPSAAAAGPTLAASSEKLILVVDDDETVRSFIETSAQMQGFQVITAVDGLDAAAKIAARAPDLIITDLMMPGQGGYEFLRSLQGSSSGGVPIFVVTGSALDDSTIRMIRAEANVVEFFAKPIKMIKFVSALHKTLNTANK